ncbi:TonB-dependent receptor [Acidithiobacillus sulfuriphilus]|uniref:TonB-dependent receptor n=2 Tax=Acidithiobacillus sulfuriphilus TaxID=1867749 RepID=A0A3M8QZU9_9PROT|nr:TonB-dependent receptor [Acidithiobacillus sulfuriphilus]RNF61605.1 TonB-dependent receptor [Acidithiobacillus sulfuriphilus]
MIQLFRIRPIISALGVLGVCSVTTVAFAKNDVTAPTSSGHKAQRIIAIGEVTGSAADETADSARTPQLPNQKRIFKSGIATKVLGRDEIEAAGPAAGGAAILNYAPGVHMLTGYSGTGASKSEISINGIKQGWGNPKGAIDNGGIAVSFDGVPMVNPSSGLWQSPQINQPSIIQGVKITYGPGNPASRWYNNIGGGINFVPLQPTEKPEATVGIGYGSYDFKNIHFSVNTGNHDGFSAVFAGGVSSGNSYLHPIVGSTLLSPSGSIFPSSSYAWYFKGIKRFHRGDVSFGAYLAKGSAYKPFVTPVTPIQGVTINGFNAKGQTIAGPLLSQSTSGFYGGIPYKEDSNTTYLLYSKLNVFIGAHTTLHNMIWYRHGNRLHTAIQFPEADAKNPYEYNNPVDNVYGEKLQFSTRLPWNRLKYGGFFLHSRYESENPFYNSGGSRSVPNDKYRNDFFNQTDLAAFIQDKIQPIKTLDITPGVRFINYLTNYTPDTIETFPESYILYPKGNEAKFGPASSSFTKPELSLAINWRPIRHLAFFVSYGEAYKIPEDGGGGGPYQSVPASAVSLEEGKEYQAGIKLHFLNKGILHHFLLSANWYHLRFSNESIFTTLANGNIINASGTSDYQGVNLSIDDDPLYWLHVFSNLSLEKADFTNYTTGGISYNGLPVTDVPSQTFNIGAYTRYYAYDILLEPRIWEQYTGPQAMFNNLTGAPSDTAKVPAYALLNLAIRATIPIHMPLLKAITANLSMLNVLGRKYDGYEYISSGGVYGPTSAGKILGYAGAPRTVYAELEAKF